MHRTRQQKTLYSRTIILHSSYVIWQGVELLILSKIRVTFGMPIQQTTEWVRDTYYVLPVL